MSKGVQIAGGATVIALLFGWYGASNLEGITYYKTLHEFQADAESQLGKATRVHVTVRNDPPHTGVDAGRTLPVVFSGLETPDLFADGAEVVVEGRLAGHDGSPVFQATKIMAKCPSKFEPKLTEPAAS
jgi:cytochrome c-type biogenesis protein CcmE